LRWLNGNVSKYIMCISSSSIPNHICC
jgi:hypothetical protein